MKEKDIFFILVQIEEAHTALCPQGVITLGIPQKNIEDRLERANTFASTEIPSDRFMVVVDPWNNAFANRFRAWPDKYYLLDGRDNYKIIRKSTYGATKDAAVDIDCADLIYMVE